MKIKFIVPFPFDEEACRRRQSLIPVTRPDTEIHFVAPRNGVTTIDCDYDMFVNEMFIFEEGIKSEEEGYDAVVIDSVSDSALAPLRSRLQIPVVGPGAVGWHVACLLGNKFSIITYTEPFIPFYKKKLDQLGLLGRLASVRAFDIHPDFRNLFGTHNVQAFRKMAEAARRCVEEDFADVVVLGSTTMQEATEYIQKELPQVPIIAPGVWACRFAELLVDMGMAHSKAGYRSPPTIVDAMLFSALRQPAPRT